MTEIQNNHLPKNFLDAYLRGNALWPQKHLATSILVAVEILASNILYVELQKYTFSNGQINTILNTMNHLHDIYNVEKKYSKDVEASNRISISDVNYLWQRSIFGSASRIVAIMKTMPGKNNNNLIPFLRNTYYEDAKLATKYLQEIDYIITKPTQKQTLEKVLNKMKEIILDKKFKSLSKHYKFTISETKKGQKLFFETRAEIVSTANEYLKENLKTEFPTLNWEYFDVNHF